MPDDRLTRSQILDFMQQHLQLDTSQVADDTLLFSSSLLDSLAMVEVIAFVEKTATVRFEPQDVTLDNLDSVSRILSFVSRAP